ncbi:MAG TPA: 50S ribosomal protein L16 [Chloroflexi bacterium]|nr:50S ribosomal protein L16 [Chloroflexota bacterium]
MLMPKRTKFRKAHRGKRRGQARRGSTLDSGDFGLQATTVGWVDSREIEAGRRSITRAIQRSGQVWIRIFPDKPVSEKPAEVRMGSGKGNVEKWVAVVKPGRIIFELAGVEEEMAREALRLASHKLSVRTRVVSRDAEVVVG